MQSVDAKRGTHASSDAVGLSPLQLGHKVRIGEVGPGHPHQVNGSGLDGVAGGSQVSDPGGVQER